ncbi:MAG: NUDIX domain-containing protein [Chloroflexi bacterium]|nr:NUDIX domain-containing protein [Chloroflexota bacterium]
MPHYCFRCGTMLQQVELDGREREQCPICGWVYYAQLKIGAAGRIVRDGQLLLVQRAIAPWKGCWYLPAGYVEVDESPDQAAERETYEETGLRVHSTGLAGLYFFDDDPRGNGLLVVYDCEVTGGEICSTPEAMRIGYFRADHLPEPLAGAAHERAIHDWVAGRQVVGG